MQIIVIIASICAALLFFIIIFWRVYFLRNPTPTINSNPNTILSPANGIIAKILPYKNENKLAEKGLFGKIPLITRDVAKEGYIVLIRLHVYNVHWQRAPIAGRIEKITYLKGKFLNAVKSAENMQCFFENERNEILIAGKIKCKVIQIAGYLARRIECFVKESQSINSSEVIGLINLGSQCALILPKNVKLNIIEGDVVQLCQKIGEIK
ncbi:MAG: phosphatidylserine decarboxylase [Candidatus Woesearchaeota archaeon]|jgi:phosphatidylserine decarboxylase